MPRPRQRRGADAKREEKRLKKEREEAEARAQEASEKRRMYQKSAMPALRTTVAVSSPSAEISLDPDALPEPDPDTKAYFRGISEKISELEELGHGRGSYGRRPEEVVAIIGPNGEEVVEELAEDERPLLLRSALESLDGHEISLAGDQESGLILERLLYAMDDFARRVLADRFTGNYVKLVKHRSASHVLQTLFGLAAETVDSETRGILASAPSTSTAAESDALPTMSALLLSILAELLPHLPELIYDSFASHIIRILLLVYSGRPIAEEGKFSAERSKRSLKFRKHQAPMRNFLSANGVNGHGEDKKKIGEQSRRVPPGFQAAFDSMWQSLMSLDEGGPSGEGVRRAAMDDVAGPAVCIMIEIEAEKTGGWRAGKLADRLMCGLVEECEDSSTATEARTELRLEYLSGLIRNPASSPTFESLLTLSSSEVFAALWAQIFHQKLHRVAGNSVANFVVAVGIRRLDEKHFPEVVEEIYRIGNERRGEWIDNSRTGVFKALLDRAADLKLCEGDVSEIVLNTFGLEKEDQKLVVPCVLSLNRLGYYKKLPENVTAVATTQGSLLLQSWLHLSSPHQQPVLDSLNSLSIEKLMSIMRDATASRVIDELLTSTTTSPRERRRFLLSLIGHYHTIADDRIGSRVVERCWSSSDVYLKEKIAASLVEHANYLQASSYGHFLARKLELPLFQRRREEWKQKMADKGLSDGTTRRTAPISEERTVEPPKRKERVMDEVDEIFNTSSKKIKTGFATTETSRTGLLAGQ